MLPLLWGSGITHTHTDTPTLPWASDRPVAEIALQHTTLILPFPRQDSNPQSQQASFRRPTPEAARPLESAYKGKNVK